MENSSVTVEKGADSCVTVEKVFVCFYAFIVSFSPCEVETGADHRRSFSPAH
jgi:hypothetical protein